MALERYGLRGIFIGKILYCPTIRLQRVRSGINGIRGRIACVLSSDLRVRLVEVNNTPLNSIGLWYILFPFKSP
jgi:hypothetical protein